MCVWRFLTTVALSCFVFLIVCLLKFWHIECHLAAKIGTNWAVSIWQVFFIKMEFLRWCYFFVRSDMCYCHHIEMISVIKFCCHSVFPAAAQTGRSVMFVLLINPALNFDTFDWTFVCFVSRSFIGYRWVVFSSVSVFSFVAMLIVIC